MNVIDIAFASPGRRRWRHGLEPLFQSLREPVMWRWIATRIWAWLWEVASATLLDVVDTFRPRSEPLLWVGQGDDPAPNARSVAIFVQFSASGHLSDMVREQMEAYRRLGFAVVLVSNSPILPEEDCAVARRSAALIVHRRNFGLDFGAWKDVLPFVLERWPAASEVLLVNDSVLGPIRPIGPVVEAMRAAGPGFFGLIESRQGGPHLQSWFVMARGSKTVGDLALFLRELRLSRSKWKIVQRAELALSRAMHQRGHRVAAVYGYAAMIDMALSHPADRAYLAQAVPRWFSGATDEAVRQRLLERPLNPAHHFWRILAGEAGCPFIKTDLVRRNPNRLPGVETWPELVPADSPCPPEMLRAHLAALAS